MDKINFSEKQIQDHIWGYKDNLSDLILPFYAPPLFRFDEDQQAISKMSAYEIMFNIIVRRIERFYKDLDSVYLFGNEISLGNDGQQKIRADLLGKSEGSPGIYIIELKKDKQTERQAFTELLAYAYQLNAKFPSHCQDDSVFVLITPLGGKTISDAYLQSLVFDGRKICLLQPVFEKENDISTLKLKPHFPILEEVILFTNGAFRKRNFDVQVHCWMFDENFWNRQPEGQNIVDMNRVSAIASQLMESKKIHGFVYTQQSFPELKAHLPLSNKLVIVGLNPYKIASENHYRKNFPELGHLETPDIFSSANDLDLSDILPGLKKHPEIHSDWNYFSDFGNNWISHLFQVGESAVSFAMVNRMKINLHNEGSYGGSFEQYEVNPLESTYVFNYDVRPTGLIRDLYTEFTKIDYQHWEKYNSHPHYGDIFGWAIENSESLILFETFLRRIFQDKDLNEDYE